MPLTTTRVSYSVPAGAYYILNPSISFLFEFHCSQKKLGWEAEWISVCRKRPWPWVGGWSSPSTEVQKERRLKARHSHCV